jgi:hypothetical protein
MLSEGVGKDNLGAHAQLARFPHFVLYQLVEKKNPDPERPWKKDKIPVNARTGGNASVNDPASWASYEVALAAFKAGQVKGRPVHGIGYVFWKGDKHDRRRLPADPFVGIDLDDCIDPDGENIPDVWAHTIITDAASYTEISPSGHGVKIIVQGKLPGPGGPSPVNKRIEVYDRGRFFALTGDLFTGSPATIEDRSDRIAKLYSEHFPAKGKPSAKRKAKVSPAVAAELARAQSALCYISAEDYHPWLNMGMALHSLDAGAESFAVWDTWSATYAKKYDAAVCQKKWASFDAEREGGITIATLFDLAIKGGWMNGNGGNHGVSNDGDEPPEQDFDGLDDEEENARYAEQERPVDEDEESQEDQTGKEEQQGESLPPKGQFLPVIRCAKDIEPELVNYLWYPYLPLGKVGLVGGNSGDGKTYLTAAITTALYQGQWPFFLNGKESFSKPGHTLIFSAEDGVEDTYIPRLINLGADRSNVHFVDGKKDWKGNLHRVVLNDKGIITRCIKDHQAKLVIFDPLQSFLPPKTKMVSVQVVTQLF